MVGALLVPLTLLCLAAPHSAPAQTATDAPSADLALTDVIFFKSGVSYIEHRGRVSGSVSTTLNFQTDQMKDVLKSLVLQDPGGQAGIIDFPSQDPLRRTMQSYRVDLQYPTGMGQLLNQLRGSAVTLATPNGRIQGTIVSAEERTSGDASAWHVNVFGNGGLRSVAMADVEALTFDDPAVQRELEEALGAVASAGDQGQKPVTIRFDGSGARTVRIAYVVEAPVWKTSYRVVLPNPGSSTGQIQGWAIIENQTDASWDDVTLTLVSGRPVSFIQDLYTPTYVQRPVVNATSADPIDARSYQEGDAAPEAESSSGAQSSIRLRGRASGAPAQSIVGQVRDAKSGEPLPGATVRIQDLNKGVATGSDGQFELRNVPRGSHTLTVSFVGFREARRTVEMSGPAIRLSVQLQPRTEQLDEVVTSAAPAPPQRNSLGTSTTSSIDVTEGISSAARTSDEGTLFRYEIANVDLPRRQSAMLPIATESVDVERMSIFDPGVHQVHPLHGARLTNSTSLNLAAGPVAVFDGSGYVGDARITDTEPGDKRFFTYALNPSIRVQSERDAVPIRVETAVIVDGELRITRRRIQKTSYTLTSDADEDETVILLHSKRPGWTLETSSDVEEETADALRLRATVPAGASEEVVIEAKRLDEEVNALTSLGKNRLLLYAGSDELPRDVRSAIDEAADRARSLESSQRRRDQAEDELQRLYDEQERIRENLKAAGDLDEEYAEQLLSKLKKQEDEIESKREEIRERNEDVQKKQRRLRDYLRSLNVN
jgi:hypothetical protein